MQRQISYWITLCRKYVVYILVSCIWECINNVQSMKTILVTITSNQTDFQ